MTSDTGSVSSMFGNPSMRIDDQPRVATQAGTTRPELNWYPPLPPRLGFSPMRPSVSAAKRARWRASSGISCLVTLPTSGFAMTGYSYDNTVDLGATTWRHVAFVERPSRDGIAWLMLSDVCKHCVHAGCLDACPTGAIIRTEFGTVVIQDDVCNGCGYCVPACPFGVPQLSSADGGSHKCTLCYDRLRGGLTPACATACPTGSIRFGPVEELREAGRERVATLKAQGLDDARLYGDDDLGGTGGIGGLQRHVRAERASGCVQSSRPAPPAKTEHRSQLRQRLLWRRPATVSPPLSPSGAAVDTDRASALNQSERAAN